MNNQQRLICCALDKADSNDFHSLPSDDVRSALLSSSLSLPSLGLTHNGLQDFNIFTQLRSLNLDNNSFSHLEPLSNLPILSTLSAKNCDLKDIRLSDAPSLEKLDVRNNQLTTITTTDLPLSLKVLLIRGNTITGLKSSRVISSLPLLQRCDVEFSLAPRKGNADSVMDTVWSDDRTAEMMVSDAKGHADSLSEKLTSMQQKYKQEINALQQRLSFIDDLSD
ncbi:hypothetical protein GEMRC1_004225 [Eukaryota sp. GEM-RC1]